MKTASAAAVAYPYPPHAASFRYRGRYGYLLTFPTDGRVAAFTEANVVALAWTQILRAGTEKGFEVVAYVFMPDHLHLVIEGVSDDADLKVFVKLAKQYIGYYYARAYPARRLLQRYGHDRIIRDEADLLERVRYVVRNPVAAGLVSRPEDYPYLGSQRWSRDQLIEWCRTGVAPK